VDGGASVNGFLMQALADITGVEVRAAAMRETTFLGAAFMAGLGIGLWKDQSECFTANFMKHISAISALTNVPLLRWCSLSGDSFHAIYNFK
jgi:glycerol kinase